MIWVAFLTIHRSLTGTNAFTFISTLFVSHLNLLLVHFLFSGVIQATEVFNFTQNNLLSDEVLVLDCHSDVYVWLGQSVNDKVKPKSLEIGQVMNCSHHILLTHL